VSRLCVIVAACVAAWGCAGRAPVPAAAPPPPFRFANDTFAFSNETVLEYDIDEATGHATWRKREPAPTFSLRCGSMARAARQFHLHARFAPDQRRPDAATLAALVGKVLAHDPRETRPTGDYVVIPGYADLRELSAANRPFFENTLGGVWWARLQRGNWRMIFPFPPGEQREEAERLAAALHRGETPILHVLRFPSVDVNHMILLFDVTETPEELRFQAYDPNDASAPIVVRWDRGMRTFVFPRTPYFGGGPVKAYGVFDGFLS
jgi:hypothetical protein